MWWNLGYILLYMLHLPVDENVDGCVWGNKKTHLGVAGWRYYDVSYLITC